MSEADNNKIRQFEELLAHQSNTIDELSETVTQQWQTIDKLEKKVAALVERFLALEDANEGSIENTKPPHY